jgi:hypothetical protein
LQNILTDDRKRGGQWLTKRKKEKRNTWQLIDYMCMLGIKETMGVPLY